MELESTTCCGCLSTNRKVETVNDFMIKKCYANIINEIPALNHNGFPISLCWLCAALLKKFTRFKHQVLQSYQALQECSQMNFCNEYHTKLTHQKLQIQKVINISILPEDTLKDKEFSVDLVKTENIEPEQTNEDISIKEEIDSFDDDDDMALIEMADKKKKNTKSDSKKQRKQKQKAEAQMFTEIELTGAQLEAERRLSRDKEEYVNAMFRCEKCILPFPNADDFKDHMSLKHEVIGKKAKKTYYKYCTVPKCKNNNKSTPDKLFFHVPKDVKLRKQWCKAMRRTKVSYQSSLHCCEDHFDNRLKYKCPICEVSLATLVSYSYHRNKHVMRYECTVCTERFTSKRMAGKHYEASHRLRPKERKISHSNQNGDGSLDNVDNSHEDSTKSEASFPCELCDKTFRWSTSLRKHAETHKIESGLKRKPYCETCKLSFTNTSNLQKHVKSSSKHQIQLRLMKLNENALEPSQPEAIALEQQVRRSVNVSRAQHTCPHCGAKYQWRGNLLRHLHTHAARAKGELVCEPCNRTFSSIATYQQHMKISKKHVSENDFKFMCSDCGKKFANKTRLKDHVNWDHLKNYVHNCQLCQKVFKSHTSLYLHKQVVHKKDNTDHLCDHCGKPFPNQAKLRCHVAALHSGEAPYKCGSCAARFSWHSCLSRHVRRVHNKRHVT